MIPKPGESIAHICARIATDLLPKASDDYAAADLAFLTVMLSMVQQDFERFADVHVREHDEMCAIFRGARDRLPPDLQARVDAVLGHDQDTSLLASALNARADVTTRLLIDVHAWAEGEAGPEAAWAVDLDREIWRFLDRYAANRTYEAAL